MREKVKIIIVDDHNIFRQGLQALLLEIHDIEIVGSVASGYEALALLAHSQSLLFITDITMEGVDGLELTRSIEERYPSIKVLVLTMHDDSGTIKDLLDAGAAGYLLKNAQKKDFIKAIQQIHQGENYFSEGVKNTLVNSMIKKKQSATVEKIHLTKRETEILSLIAEELTNASISEKLFISLHTVETHRRNIMKKLNVHNGVGLLRQAIQLGLASE